MIDFEQTVVINISRKKTREWFKNKGYQINEEVSTLNVRAIDLQKNSNLKINVTCDYCTKVFQQSFQYINDNLENNNNKKDCCKACEPLKRVERALLGYGVDKINEVIEYMLNNSLKQIKAIYKIKNVKNGKAYIGSSTRLLKRLNSHFEELRKATHSSRAMIEDFNTDGREAFKCYVLELITDDQDLVTKEQKHVNWHINKKISLYNSRILDVAKNKGIIASKETRENMSLGQTGRKFSEAHKRKISMSMIGKNSGEKSHLSKLNESQVRKIREEVSRGIATQQIAKNFDVSPKTVRNIANFNSWKHVI